MREAFLEVPSRGWELAREGGGKACAKAPQQVWASQVTWLRR